MKTIVIFCFALIHVISAEKEHTKKLFSDCATELSVGTDKVTYFLENGRLNDETEKSAKCVFLCVSKKKGMSDDSGVLNKNVYVEQMSASSFSKEKLQSIAEECSKTSETDPCDKVYHFSKCSYEKLVAKN